MKMKMRNVAKDNSDGGKKSMGDRQRVTKEIVRVRKYCKGTKSKQFMETVSVIVVLSVRKTVSVTEKVIVKKLKCLT